MSHPLIFQVIFFNRDNHEMCSRFQFEIVFQNLLSYETTLKMLTCLYDVFTTQKLPK